MKTKVAVIIPCYKAKNKVGDLFNSFLKIKLKLIKKCDINFFLIDDFCPESSYREVPKSDCIKIIHNKKNLGVGASTLIGFQKAIKDNNQIFIKMDADGQHQPEYLIELIPYLLSLPKNELILVKGSRYQLPIRYGKTPFTRRLGSFLLEPMARMSLIYKGLTDISNGFISFNKITLQYILSKKFKSKIESRYLFECSLLKKCSNFRADIHQFPMDIVYGDNWSSSMKSSNMIYPLLRFWVKSLVNDLFNKYIFQLNLGSFFLISSMISFTLSALFLNFQILPKIYSKVFVTAGNASIFSAFIITSILLLSLFILYDYSKKKNVKNVFFNQFIK